MKKKLRVEVGKKWAEVRWIPVRTRKMEIIQELYKLKDKKTIDYLIKEHPSVEWLEEFLKVVKGQEIN